MAESRYRAALKVAPNNGHVYHNYGTYLCKQGEYEKANQYFLDAVTRPNYYQIAESYENAGLCALKNKQFKNAQRYFEKSLEHEHCALTPQFNCQLGSQKR